MCVFKNYILIICLLAPVTLFAKGDDIGFWMEGKVANVKVNGENIQLLLTGEFWFVQHPDGQPDTSRITINLKQGGSVTVIQADNFFAMSPDWRAGAIRGKRGLLKIINAAAGNGRKIKFQLTDPIMAFGPEQRFTLIDATVIRATDAGLQ